MSKLLLALALILAFSAPALAALGRRKTDLTSDASSLPPSVNGSGEMPNLGLTGGRSAILTGRRATTPPPTAPTAASRSASHCSRQLA